MGETFLIVQGLTEHGTSNPPQHPASNNAAKLMIANLAMMYYLQAFLQGTAQGFAQGAHALVQTLAGE